MSLKTNKAMVDVADYEGSIDTIHVEAVEHYEIMRPPYKQAGVPGMVPSELRTDHYTLDICDDERIIDISVMVSADKLMELSTMFANAARNAYRQMYVVKR